MPQGHEGDSDQPSPPAISEVPEVTTSDAFMKNCTDLTGLCIIAALNPAGDDFTSQKATFQVCSEPPLPCFACCALRIQGSLLPTQGEEKKEKKRKEKKRKEKKRKEKKRKEKTTPFGVNLI